MGKINVLSFAVANLIAAGEVVDRPSSVIKELMENAIDAKATNIVIEVQNGGVTYMRVTDNGCGIDKDDLPIAIRRHATSKIKDASDLESICTLGFRGEALAAIASVSEMRILSKQKEAEVGNMLTARAGEILSISEQGSADGTTVIVENLFFNVPARRKFLKKDITEAMAVSSAVEKVALSHPEIAFRLISDGNIKLETNGDGNLAHTLYSLYGRDFASKLIPVSHNSEGILVKGYIGRTDNYRPNRNMENFFINGRFVKSKTAGAALEQAFTSYMPPEKFPVCALFITIPPTRVDVNVHPAKLEVKFSNEKVVFEAIYYAVRPALEDNKTRPELKTTNPYAQNGISAAQYLDAIQERKNPSFDPTGSMQQQPQRMTAEDFQKMYGNAKVENPYGNKTAVPTQVKINATENKNGENLGKSAPVQEKLPENSEKNTPVQEFFPNLPHEEAVPKPRENSTQVENSNLQNPIINHAETKVENSNSQEQIPLGQEQIPVGQIPQQNQAPVKREYRIIGEAFHSYVLVEVGESLLLIDKHAAHERILFEEMKARLYAEHKEEMPSQKLIVPLEIMLTNSEIGCLKEYNSELEKIGYSVRYGKNTLYVDAIPTEVKIDAVTEILSTMAERVANGTGSVKLTRNILFEKALYQCACKAAIKAGRAYTDEHTQWIVKKLMELPDITFCPHGRPVALELTHKNLDRQFDRSGF